MLSTSQFAKKLKISRIRVLQMIDQGIIKKVERIGRSYAIDENELKRFKRVKRGKIYRIEILDGYKKK